MPSRSGSPSAAAAIEHVPPLQPPASREAVSKWLVDTTSDIASIRAGAIASLATAPSEQAVPALGRILISGDKVDRQLALKSLSRLAQAKGDSDGRIRGVLREAIYHSDDDDATDSARATLDEVDRLPSIAAIPAH